MADPLKPEARKRFIAWRAEHPHLVLYPDTAWDAGYQAGSDAMKERAAQAAEAALHTEGLDAISPMAAIRALE